MLIADFLSVFRGVVEFNFTAGTLFGGIDDAGIEGAGIDVQADRPLIEFARIENAVHGLKRINGTGLSRIHFNRVGGRELAGALLKTLGDDPVILDQEFSDGDGHPAILVTVIVYGTGLTYFPADCYQFVERSFVDQVSSVVLTIPGQKLRETVWGNLRFLEKVDDLVGAVEGRLRKFA